MNGTYLLQTSSGQYRFRIRIPTHLAAELGIKEIRRSLETDSLQLAELLATKKAVEYKLAFAAMKKKRSRNKSERNSLSTGLITFLDANYREVKVDFGGDAERELYVARELMSTQQKQNTDNLTAHTETLLSEAVRRYLEEQRSKGLAELSISDYQTMLRDFINLHGNTTVQSVSRESVVIAYTKFKKLPPNRNKSPQLKHLSLDQLLELQNEKTVSKGTSRKFVSRISQFFNWCAKWEMLQQNPASGLMEKRGNESTERLPLEDNDLSQLFGSPEYQSGKFKHSYQYWVPLIGLFTGARLNEICQLRVEDIISVEGLTCFNITPDAGKLKTPASKRCIPIHSQLLAYGLLDFINNRKQQGTTRLFPELPLGREGPGQAASKWFGRYRKRCGVNDRKKPFHSFRHTVWTKLSWHGCPEYEIDDLIGHESQSVGARRYRSKLLPSHLQKTVEKLRYNADALDTIRPYTNQ
jgi:integrase